MSASQTTDGLGQTGAEPPFGIEVSSDDKATDVRLSGAIDIHSVTQIISEIDTLPSTSLLRIDISGVERLDTAGAWMLTTLRNKVETTGGVFTLDGARAEAEGLMKSVAAAMPRREDVAASPTGITDILERTGKSVVSGISFILELSGFLGMFLARLARAVRHPREFRLTSLVHHCDEVGLKAVPIVGLMAFLIGVVLAFQGSTQLRQFGAEVFVVDLIAISILRELGILLTSIIVAGRTASSFTAAIGSMKMREEIDAMRTLGLDPAMVLFVPRILALFLMLPILGLIANVSGLIGGAMMAWIDLGISPQMFISRLIEGTDISHVFVGMVKAPVFALIIGVVGCHAGMQVESNAESLGRMTSNAVVTAIFAVIVADAVFSIFFARLGI